MRWGRGSDESFKVQILSIQQVLFKQLVTFYKVSCIRASTYDCVDILSEILNINSVVNPITAFYTCEIYSHLSTYWLSILTDFDCQYMYVNIS